MGIYVAKFFNMKCEAGIKKITWSEAERIIYVTLLVWDVLAWDDS